jgi:hypothetical protein
MGFSVKIGITEHFLKTSKGGVTMYPRTATAAQIMVALMAAINWKSIDIKQKLGFNQSEISKLLSGEVGFTKKTEKLVDLFLEHQLSDEQKREFGWEIFLQIHRAEVLDLAKKAGWLPRPGSNLKLDQFLLPDGFEAPADEAYSELCNALDATKIECGM